MHLSDYMQKHIFQPLCIENINFVPTPDMKKSLAYFHTRRADKRLNLTDYMAHRGLAIETKEEKAANFLFGGSGLFGSPSDYGRKPPFTYAAQSFY